MYQDRGVRAVVLMNHFDPTAGQAYLAGKHAPNLEGCVGIVLKPGYPSGYNDSAVTETIRASVTDIAGEETLMEAVPRLGAEDFNYMCRLVPGAMFMLGAKYDEMDRPHHTPVFNIDESVLPLGAAVLADAACRLLKEKA